MSSKKSTQFNCFSPPVMLATVIIEFTLAFYTVWRYKMTVLTRLVAATLISLGIFQVAEYFVCTNNLSSSAVPWSKLGFVAITALPPLGLHMMHVLAGKPQRRLVGFAYLTMALFMGFFLMSSAAFTGHECTGNYVIFQFTERVTGLYSAYYYVWLLAGIILGFSWANEFKAKGKAALKNLQAIQGLIVGYLVFLVPTALTNTFQPQTRRGIPSILCGFAILLAIVLVLYVMPKAGQAKNLTTKRN